MTVLQVQSLPVLANQHRHTHFLDFLWCTLEMIVLLTCRGDALRERRRVVLFRSYTSDTRLDRRLDRGSKINFASKGDRHVVFGGEAIHERGESIKHNCLKIGRHGGRKTMAERPLFQFKTSNCRGQLQQGCKIHISQWVLQKAGEA